jgi:hypothetical protein
VAMLAGALVLPQALWIEYRNLHKSTEPDTLENAGTFLPGALRYGTHPFFSSPGTTALFSERSRQRGNEERTRAQATSASPPGFKPCGLRRAEARSCQLLKDI